MLQSRSPLDRNPLGWIVSVILTVVVIYIVASVGIWLLKLLWWVPLIMIGASLVIDRTVAVGFVKSIKSLFERRFAYGVAASVMSLIAYPLVGMYMLGMALFRKKLKERAVEVDEQVNGKWTEFEDVTEEPLDLDIPYEELPPAPEPQRRGPAKGNEYDDLFQ